MKIGMFATIKNSGYGGREWSVGSTVIVHEVLRAGYMCKPIKNIDTANVSLFFKKNDISVKIRNTKLSRKLYPLLKRHKKWLVYE